MCRSVRLTLSHNFPIKTGKILKKFRLNLMYQRYTSLKNQGSSPKIKTLMKAQRLRNFQENLHKSRVLYRNFGKTFFKSYSRF